MKMNSDVDVNLLKIAICDSNVSYCSELEEWITGILVTYNIEMCIEHFYSGKTLYNYLRKDNYFDLIFLEVDLQDLDGIETGKLIRSCPLSGDTQIAYMSGNASCALSLFQNRPIDFLLKPIDKMQVLSILNATYNFFSKNKNHLFTCKVNSIYFTIPMHKIVYFQSENRKVRIVSVDTDNPSICFYEKLEEVYSRLNHYVFLRIHKSYVVNHRYIKQILLDRVILYDNSYLPISQKYRNSIKEVVTYLHS